jgi:hypothetical protein
MYRLTAPSKALLDEAYAAILSEGLFETILPPQPLAKELSPEVVDVETGEEISPAVFGPITWWLGVLAPSLPQIPSDVSISEDESIFTVKTTQTQEEFKKVGFPPLSRRQMLLWLLSAGITEEMVHKQIAAIPDEVLSEATRIEFENNDRIHRDHPLLTALGAAFGITPAAIDAAWPEALKL